MQRHSISGVSLTNYDYATYPGNDGHICPYCKAWVGAWQVHHCQQPYYPYPPSTPQPTPAPQPIPLSEEDIERIAKRVVELLCERDGESGS
jgi:hypothetical protein